MIDNLTHQIARHRVLNQTGFMAAQGYRPPPDHDLLSKMVREQKSLVGVNIFCNTLLDPLKKPLAALSVGIFHGGIRGRLPPQKME
jgi:hypothetical protein